MGPRMRVPSRLPIKKLLVIEKSQKFLTGKIFRGLLAALLHPLTTIKRDVIEKMMMMIKACKAPGRGQGEADWIIFLHLRLFLTVKIGQEINK